MMSRDDRDVELDILVVGAGFAGLLQLYHFRKLGYKVKVVEAASGLGGIWYWQSYPGARVDSEVPLYEYSMKELWEEWNYTERFPARAEILAYFEYVDKKLDLSKDIDFNTRVKSAEFDNNTNKWHVKTEGGKVYVAKILDLCVGFGANPYTPPFKGANEFKGEIHHSNNWSQEVDLRGKRVAVIGTGATGVQIIQEIGPKVGHLTVFQRTPNFAIPMRNPKLTVEEQTLDKAKYPEVFGKTRLESFAGFMYSSVSKKAFEDSYDARQAFYEDLWNCGDFHFWLANYSDLFLDEAANADAYDFWRKKVRARLTSPAMQDKLAPAKQPHAFGTKRPSLECNYYEVFNQPNVDLVDVRENPIDCFTPNGIRTADGTEHLFDAIVLATGFDALSGAIIQIDIKGTIEDSIKDKWAKGTRTYLGMATFGFPNLFFLYNVGSPAPFSNGPTCVEIQSEWLVKFIDHELSRGTRRIEVSEKAESEWTQKVHEAFAQSLFPNTDSWYLGANIPGKKREPVCFLGGIPMYRNELQIAEKGYKGFVTG